jgi:hypothetical protein
MKRRDFLRSLGALGICAAIPAPLMREGWRPVLARNLATQPPQLSYVEHNGEAGEALRIAEQHLRLMEECMQSLGIRALEERPRVALSENRTVGSDRVSG